MMEPKIHRVSYLSHPDLRSLKCPLCSERMCVYGTNCEVDGCEKHHISAHNLEEGNELQTYLKTDYESNNIFSNYQNLLISFIVGDEELFDLLEKHLENFSKDSPRISSRAPQKKVEYADAMVLLAFQLNNNDVLERLKKIHSTSKHWPIQLAEEFFEQINELIEMYPVKSGYQAGKNIFEEEIHSILLKVFKSKTPAHLIYAMIKKILHHYGSNTKLKTELIDWLIEHENRIIDFNQWISRLWWYHVYLKDEEGMPFLDVRKIEKMLTRAMRKKRNTKINYNLCHLLGQSLFSRLQGKIPADPYAKQLMPKVIQLNLDIFENLPAASSYISFLDKAHDYGLTKAKVTFPDWLDEKLINAPENIPKFELLCNKFDIKFNFMKYSRKFPLTRFSEVLNYNHISNIVGTKPIFQDENEIDYSENIEFGGDGKISGFDELPTHKMLENGIILDFPNIIRLTLPSSPKKLAKLSRDEKNEKYFESCELWINWINSQKHVCYIHTTPNACSRFCWLIDRIQKRTEAVFLYYNFNEEQDEDLFYLKSALEKNALILTRDKFADLFAQLDLEIFERIKSASKLKPQLNELGEIEIVEKA